MIVKESADPQLVETLSPCELQSPELQVEKRNSSARRGPPLFAFVGPEGKRTEEKTSVITTSHSVCQSHNCMLGLRTQGSTSCAYPTNNVIGLSGGHKYVPP